MVLGNDRVCRVSVPTAVASAVAPSITSAITIRRQLFGRRRGGIEVAALATAWPIDVASPVVAARVIAISAVAATILCLRAGRLAE